MTASMPLALQFQLYGDQIPFIRDRRYTAFLPEEEHGKGRYIQDEWDVLATLIECSDERIDRVVVRQGAEDFVRIKIYGGAHLAREHLVPIPRTIVERLLGRRLIEETSRSRGGHTEQTEFGLTAPGMNALVDHIRGLQKQKAL